MARLVDALYKHIHKEYFLSLFPEEGPGRCHHPTCSHLTIRTSRLCARHHYEASKKRPCPWKEDYSDVPVPASKQLDGDKLCAMCERHKTIGARWFEEKATLLCDVCCPRLDPMVEWYEDYRALLECRVGDAIRRETALFRLLGKAQSHVRTEDGEWLTDEVVKHLSLCRGQISFEFTEMARPVAGSVEAIGNGYSVKMSRELDDNFRAVSAILIHEMVHIFLNSHGMFYITQRENEELTDFACVLLGFGIPMVNAKHAWKVERMALGGGGVAGGTSYYDMGYLSENEIGYALARFLAERGVDPEELRDAIDDHCWRAVRRGVSLEQASRPKLAAYRKAKAFLSKQHPGIAVCEFSCPVCFQELVVPKETINRVTVLKTECPKCKSVIHFDGEKVVKFIESLK